jgi:hypothetical protein
MGALRPRVDITADGVGAVFAPCASIIEIRFDGFVLSSVMPYGITKHPSDSTNKECSFGRRVSRVGVLHLGCDLGY